MVSEDRGIVGVIFFFRSAIIDFPLFSGHLMHGKFDSAIVARFYHRRGVRSLTDRVP